MPLGLPRRSYDNGSPACSRAIDENDDQRVEEPAAAHRRTSSFGGATQRPRVRIPLPGQLFKGLAVFHHDHHRHPPLLLVVDTCSDNPDSPRLQRQQNPDLIVGSSQVQSQPSKSLSLFAHPTPSLTHATSSSLLEPHSSSNNDKNTWHSHSRSEGAMPTKDTLNGSMASVTSASPSKVRFEFTQFRS